MDINNNHVDKFFLPGPGDILLCSVVEEIIYYTVSGNRSYF